MGINLNNFDEKGMNIVVNEVIFILNFKSMNPVVITIIIIIYLFQPFLLKFFFFLDFNSK